ncbi:MAG TPA: LssY C-terminal domain-containing protein [Candidatus Saccharimonadales bacterium]|nr:LssY C-terminal domain-containing protein [Candidatus Saccharimonadales bacterium]
MIQYLIRLAKRFAVLIPGLVIAYFSVRNVLPYFDRRLPLGIAIFLTYVLGAYVLIPAIIRLWRMLRPASHLPLYCVTPDGFASDPLNVGIIGTRRQLIEAMEGSGWHVADPRSLRNNIREMLSAVYGWSYPNAPVSNLYLFGRRQDIAFQIPVEGVQGGSRHHVRFWATTYEDKKPLAVHTIHWHHRREHVYGDNLLWVGAASLDDGVNFIRHNFQLTHMIDPDTDKERELIVRGLKAERLVDKLRIIKLGEPYKLINRVISGSLHTDGRMAVITLRSRPRR